VRPVEKVLNRLEGVVESNGSYKGLCPTHDDRKPSLSVSEGDDGRALIQCFAGCTSEAIVDVLGLRMADLFNAEGGGGRPYPSRNGATVQPSFTQKAVERRKKQPDGKTIAQVCHGALEKHPRVREWWEERGFGEELQARFLLGADKDGTEAVIPFWHRSEIRGLIRRRLEGEPKYRYPSAEEFVDGYRPLFVPGFLRGEVFLVEGIIDALAIAAVGRSAIAVGGTGISKAQMAELRRLLREDVRVYILPDDDEQGAEAARKWARQLYPQALICKADYGAEDRKDAADLFAGAGATQTVEYLGRLAATSEDLMDIEARVAAELGSPRRRFDYAVEHVIPLAARITSESTREFALGIVVGQLDGVNFPSLKKAVGEELERLGEERFTQLMKEQAKEQERQQEEYPKKVEKAQDDIDALFGPGVLQRLRKEAAEIHNVKRDEKALDLALLVALGAQLSPLPNGRPLGASMLLTADAGRGKNHIVDAAVTPLPEEFYLTFEIASGQSLYYAAAEDPTFLKHRFVYPNEIEGVDALVEFLRPMLSKGWAKKLVTNKDSGGRNAIQEIIVEGPVTAAIPTVRNKTDEQLQTRLLVAELPDYVGRVKEHSKAVSELLHPTYSTADHSGRLFLWQEGFRQLTKTRRVVCPLEHPDFALDDDKVSHGARLWTNLLGLMAAHAWIEQKNRRRVELASGELAIVAIPEDYEVAYNIFTAVCQRTVVNLSENHRKILGAVYDLHGEFPNRERFTQREIASGAGVSPQTVSNNKTFLVTSAKLLKDTERGLALPEGADPTWWSDNELSTGLPTPKKVRSWWEDAPPDPPPGDGGQGGHAAETDEKPHTYPEKAVQRPLGQPLDTSSFPEGGTGHPAELTELVHPLSSGGLDSENSSDKRHTDDEEGVSTASSASITGASTYLRASENPALIADDDDGVNV
jgi:DNA primase